MPTILLPRSLNVSLYNLLIEFNGNVHIDFIYMPEFYNVPIPDNSEVAKSYSVTVFAIKPELELAAKL